MTLPASVTLTEPVPGYPVYEITHPRCSARVAGHGAHVMEWRPAGHEPVLYLSPESVFRDGKAIRGGVPVCWPWFNAHPSRPELPSHGFARTRVWRLESAAGDEEGVRLDFELRDNDATRALWPHAFRLRLSIRLGASLRLGLSTENTGEAAFSITQALHTYIAVRDISSVRVEGFDGASYLDTAGAPAERTQTGEVVFTGEVDRLYASAGPATVVDKTGKRGLHVATSGSHTLVVWNPWIEKAAALKDLPDEDYRRFVCVETANAWRDTVEVAPGQTHTLGMELLVSNGATAEVSQYAGH